MFGGPYLSRPTIGEIVATLALGTLVSTIVSPAGLVVGPIAVALYYAYTWPRKTR